MSYESASRRKELDIYTVNAEPNAEKREGESRFASLTAGLLARKGEAEPALEPFKHARVAPGSAREMAPGERHAVEKLAAGEVRKAHVEPINDAGEAREEWQRVSPASVEASEQKKPAAPEDAPRMSLKAAQGLPKTGQDCPREKIAASTKRSWSLF